MSNNIYDILGKLKNILPAQDTPKETAKQPIYESVESRGDIMEAVKSLEEKYMGFKKTVAAIKKGGSAEDPEAVAASIGRKKYGKKKFQKAAAQGKKLGEAAKPDYIDLDKDGDRKESMKKAAKDAKKVKEGREHKSKDEFDNRAKEGDYYYTSAGNKVTKTAGGVKHEKMYAKDKDDDREDLEEMETFPNAPRNASKTPAPPPVIKRVKEGRGVEINGKPVNVGSIEVDGVDSRDYPDFADAYITYAEFADGSPLSDDELDQLTDQHGELVNQAAHDNLQGMADFVNEKAEQLDELSPRTLQSYAGKARGQGQWAHGVSQAGGVSDRDKAAYAKLANKRFAGAKAAEKKVGMEPGEAGSTSYDWANKGGYGDKNTPAKKYGAVNEGRKKSIGDLIDLIEPQLEHEARYKDVDWDEASQNLYWVTQETNDYESQQAAEQIAAVLAKHGYAGWHVNVVVRDDWHGEDSPWQTAVVESAPPGAKAERMVKHIKKGYAKDGKLTKKEKGIAYATAWKAHNKGQVEEGTQFGDAVKNSQAKLTDAKKYVTEGSIRNHPIYTTQEAWDHYAKELAEEEQMEVMMSPQEELLDAEQELDEIAALAGVARAVAPAVATTATNRVMDKLGMEEGSSCMGSMEEELMDEEAVDEGNEFTKARLDAIAAGHDSFEVGGKIHKVTGETGQEKAQVEESLSVNINATDEDVVALMQKLSGLPVVAVAPASESSCGHEAMQEERDIEWDNTPNEDVAPLSASTPNGTDLHKSKRQDPHTANKAANPLGESEEVVEGLWKKYESMLKDLKA